MRSIPLDVAGAPEYRGASTLLRIVHKELRPATALRVFAFPKGKSAADALIGVAAESRLVLDASDAAALVTEATRLRLWAVKMLEGGEGELHVAALPPSVIARREERYAAQRGPRGGAGTAERKRDERRRKRDEQEAAEGAEASEGAEEASEVPAGAIRDTSRGGVTGSVEASASPPASPPVTEKSRPEGPPIRDTAAPPPVAPGSSPPPSPLSPKGGEREEGREETPAPARRFRTAKELENEPSSVVGTLAMEWLSERTERVWTLKASVEEKMDLGAAVKARGFGEEDLRVVASCVRKNPEALTRMFATSSSIGQGAPVTVAFLLGPKNNPHANLNRAVAFARTWWEKQRPQREPRPGVVAAQENPSAPKAAQR